MLWKVPLNNKFKYKKKILTIINKFSHRYSINSFPGQNYTYKISYINDLKSILKNLKKKLTNKCLQIRHTHTYRGSWYVKDYLDKEDMKNINFEDSSIPFLKKGIYNSSLFIVLINSTLHLETLSGNYFAQDNRVYDTKALNAINKLKKVKIFHSSISSLTDHAAKIWPDVNKWWSSDEVQNVVKNYCNNYAKPVENRIIKLKKLLESEKNLN